MPKIDEIVKNLLAKGKYAVDVEHIEEGKNKARKIFVMDVLHVLFSTKSTHEEGKSLDRKLVVFTEGFDANGRFLRVVSRLIDEDGEIIISITQADIAENIFAKTAYELNKEGKK